MELNYSDHNCFRISAGAPTTNGLRTDKGLVVIAQRGGLINALAGNGPRLDHHRGDRWDLDDVRCSCSEASR